MKAFIFQEIELIEGRKTKPFDTQTHGNEIVDLQK